MRQAQPNPHPTANAAGSSFSVFRVPGSRYAASTSSNGSGGPPGGVPLTVGPSLDFQGNPSGGRNSYTSTLPASPPYRESMPDMGLEDYDALDNGGIGWMRTGRVVRVKETGQSYRFPLDDEHLPQIELSRQDIVSLRETMETAIERAVKNGGVSWMENPTMAPANSKYSWKVHLEKKNCIMYRRKNDPPLARNFLVRCKLDASLDDVMYGVMSDNTEDERTYLAHVHRDDFLDGAVLQLLARPNVEDPYQLFAVKWSAFQSPMDSMFSIRDMFYVEYSRTVIDPKGQKVVARVFQSINPREFNAVEREFGFVRNDITWVMLFRVLPGSNDTKTDVSLSGSVQFPNKANTPSWMANRFLSSMYSIVTGMATAGDAKFIVNHQLVTEKPWVPNHERSACSVCLKSFSLLRHRHHCRICAEIMCTSCTLELALRTSMLPLSLRPEGGLISTEKFCFTCIEQARRDRAMSLAQELAIASHAAAQAAAMAAAYEEGGDKENLGGGRHSEPFQYQPHHLQQPMHPQQYMDGGIPRAVSAESVQSAGLGWNGSGKLISTRQQLAPPPPPVGTVPGSDLIPLVPTNANNYPRVRSYHDDPRQPLRAANGMPTVLDPNAIATELPRQSDDVVTATAIPSSFAKMEESIAAQQMLLRNMLMEGQKIMQQQQQQYYAPPPPRPQYSAIRASPQIDVLDDLDHVPPPHLAPRPSDLM